MDITKEEYQKLVQTACTNGEGRPSNLALELDGVHQMLMCTIVEFFPSIVRPRNTGESPEQFTKVLNDAQAQAQYVAVRVNSNVMPPSALSTPTPVDKERFHAAYQAAYAMFNASSPKGRYYRGVIEQAFDVLGLGKPKEAEKSPRAIQ